MAKRKSSGSSAPKAERKRHSILFWPALLLNIAAAIPLLMAWCASFTPPSWSGAVVCCGIGFKYILWANLAFVVLWLPFNYPWCLISLSLVLLNVSNNKMDDGTFQASLDESWWWGGSHNDGGTINTEIPEEWFELSYDEFLENVVTLSAAAHYGFTPEELKEKSGLKAFFGFK